MIKYYFLCVWNCESRLLKKAGKKNTNYWKINKYFLEKLLFNHNIFASEKMNDSLIMVDHFEREPKNLSHTKQKFTSRVFEVKHIEG